MRSEHRITAEGETEQGAIPASVESQVAAVDGVATTAPLVEGRVQIVGRRRRPHRRQRTADARLELGDHRVAQPVEGGRRPRAAAAGEVVIDRASADDR